MRLPTMRAFALAILALLGVLLAPARARAASPDENALKAAGDILDGDFANGDFANARTKAEAALARCATRCSSQAQAPLHILLAMVAAQAGKHDDAVAELRVAQHLDAGARLPPSANAEVQSAWDEARQVTPAATPGEEGGPATPTPTPSHVPGWSSVEAFQEASAGLTADMAGKLPECVEHDKKSVEMEEQPRTRLHLSSCEARGGHLLDALQDAQKALEDGIRKRDLPVTKISRERVEQLLRRIPHITFVPSLGVEHLQITFDDKVVPPGAATRRFSIDPGEHSVHAEGLENGIPLSFAQKYTVTEGQLLQVQLVLKSQAPEYLSPGQLQCMLAAKDQEDVLKCLPQKNKPLEVKAGTQLSGYSDTTNVEVWSPELHGAVISPTQGWNVAGHVLVDVVTAASPDIVSEASPPYHEQRYAGGLSGGYKIQILDIEGQVNYSQEPDYISSGGGLSVTADLDEKLVTPRLGANYSHDSVGRGPNNFIANLDTTEIEAGCTVVLSATSLLVASATAQFERGDQSKPYRYVPMFNPITVAPYIVPGQSVDSVNELRLPLRPTEQLPTERDRYAIGARFAHRFQGATLRIEERIYTDSWSLTATTTDGRYIFDLGRHLEVWPHGRFNAQGGANFYQLAYSATVNAATSQLVVPLYRTTDRELSPLVSLTGGGGAHYLLSSPEAKTLYGVSIQGDLMYSHYFDSLYITQRTAIYGTVGFDMEFD